MRKVTGVALHTRFDVRWATSVYSGGECVREKEQWRIEIERFSVAVEPRDGKSASSLWQSDVRFTLGSCPFADDISQALRVFCNGSLFSCQISQSSPSGGRS